MNTCFQNVFDDINDRKVRQPGTIHIVTALVSVVNRNNPTEILLDTQVDIHFYNERNYLGGRDPTSWYEIESVNYWVRNKALNYFSNPNYVNKPEDVKHFHEVTKNKSWCFDSVVINIKQKYWDGKQIS
jgi:hypothetical protein